MTKVRQEKKTQWHSRMVGLKTVRSETYTFQGSKPDKRQHHAHYTDGTSRFLDVEDRRSTIVNFHGSEGPNYSIESRYTWANCAHYCGEMRMSIADTLAWASEEMKNLKVLRAGKEPYAERLYTDKEIWERQVRNVITGSKSRSTFTGSTQEVLGTGFDLFRAHLMRGYFEIYGVELVNFSDIHIDHKVPIRLARNEDEAKALCHYSNLQALTPEDNMAKGGGLYDFDVSGMSTEVAMIYNRAWEES